MAHFANRCFQSATSLAGLFLSCLVITLPGRAHAAEGKQLLGPVEELAILAIWSAAAGPQRVAVRVGSASAVEVIDIMGHSTRAAVRGGVLDLALDGSPQYIVGIAPNL